MITLTTKDLSGSDMVNDLITSFYSVTKCREYLTSNISSLKEKLELKIKKEDIVTIRSLIGFLNNCLLILALRDERIEKEKQEEKKSATS